MISRKYLYGCIIFGFISLSLAQSAICFENLSTTKIVGKTLAGTKWDVFVIQFPLWRNDCGGATVAFDSEGEAIIEWDDTSFEGLPFPYSEQVSVGNSIMFAINDIQETFSMFGLGVAIIDRGIKIKMFSCGPGHYGVNYIIFGVPEECAEEGEMFSFVYSEYPDHCCDGLTEWHSGFDTRISIGGDCYETGFEAGAPVGTCINCGNGSCEDIEDICNCPEDCAGGLNSDYATVDEFCSSEFWSNSMASACEELEELEVLPICDLCE